MTNGSPYPLFTRCLISAQSVASHSVSTRRLALELLVATVAGGPRCPPCPSKPSSQPLRARDGVAVSDVFLWHGSQGKDSCVVSCHGVDDGGSDRMPVSSSSLESMKNKSASEKVPLRFNTNVA